MQRRLLVGSVLAVLTAFAGCKKDKKQEPPPGPGTGAGTGVSAVEPPRVRASDQPQPQLPPLDLPEDARRAEKIALGHALFFDKRLSGANDRSCYSCHQNEDGNGGHDPVAVGSGDKVLTRHSPVIWNVGYWKKAFYWDGRAPTLEANVNGAWALGNMGGAPGADTPEKITAALDKRAARLAAIPGYKKLFAAAFPDAKVVKAEHVNSAIAEYMRTMVCKDTAYDKFAAGDKAALDDAQKRGLDVFSGKGKCITCHAPPFFSTAMPVDGGAYFNVGIGTKDIPEDKVDVGRMKVTNQPTDWAAFKPPSLRNVKKSPPYFHDGSVAKLEDAVRLMATGGIPNKNKNPLVEDTKLTDAELADLVAFLGALDCPNRLEEPKLP
jgi:cytochrome c peroxidase